MKYLYLLSIIIGAIMLTACKIQTLRTHTDDGKLLSKYQQLKKTAERHGFYKMYHENGKPAVVIFYKNGKLQGQEKGYHENGQLHYLANSENGSYEGPFKYWYATGVLHQEGNYINNNIEGDLKTYYPNGVLKEIVFFSRSIENGPFVIYFQNSKLKEEGHFLNGPYPDGTLKQYNDEGILIRKKQCIVGICETVWELSAVDNNNE